VISQIYTIYLVSHYQGNVMTLDSHQTIVIILL